MRSRGVITVLNPNRGRRVNDQVQKKSGPPSGPSKRAFKDRLKLLMAEHQPPLLGPTDLGRVLGVHKQTAGKWLTRTKHLRAEDLYCIADYFKVSARWLWREQGPRQPRYMLDETLTELVDAWVQITDKDLKEAAKSTINSFAALQTKSYISKL